MAVLEVGVVTLGHHCAFLQTDNEVLRAEDPHAQRVLRGVWRTARLSEWIHAEGIRDEEDKHTVEIYKPFHIGSKQKRKVVNDMYVMFPLSISDMVL